TSLLGQLGDAPTKPQLDKRISDPKSNCNARRLEHWCSLESEPKTLFGYPEWLLRPIVRTKPKKGRPGPRPFNSVQAQRMELPIVLADTAGVTIEGLRIRISAWENRQMDDITATLECLAPEQWVCISRVDFLPPAPHGNKHWKRYRLDPEVFGSHLHACADNARIGGSAFTPEENLPNAVPLVSEPQSFRDICRMLEEVWNVDGLLTLPSPDWKGGLLC
ncbi:hypothetical protein VQ044_19860, partial [Aurantimonas sp. C2-5-R2]